MHRVISVVILVVAAACAASQKQPQTAANAGSGSGSGSDVQCHEVTDTGSMFSHQECTTSEETKTEHDDAERYMQKPRNMNTSAH